MRFLIWPEWADAARAPTAAGQAEKTLFYWPPGQARGRPRPVHTPGPRWRLSGRLPPGIAAPPRLRAPRAEGVRLADELLYSLCRTYVPRITSQGPTNDGESRGAAQVYGLYLLLFFHSGHYLIFFYVFILPILMIVRFRDRSAFRARQEATAFQGPHPGYGQPSGYAQPSAGQPQDPVQ